MAAPVGFEPTTSWLTVKRSASWAKGPYLRKRKVSVLQTVSFHYTSSPVRITDGVISLMTISPSLSSSFFILHIYYIIFFIKNQKRFFIHTRRFFMIFYAALPLSYSPILVEEEGFEPPTRDILRIIRKIILLKSSFFYLTYILYNIFYKKSKKIF